ncbi:unnamed protein product [Echinostoma caproni]|uniref:DUF4806 domain-containing protein n=1 Tax=Echinostoma caproni TaxID=27848 RepID=A0A183APR8_9TREM|nr:unnamed protein product [Echinostoma caproni]
MAFSRIEPAQDETPETPISLTSKSAILSNTTPFVSLNSTVPSITSQVTGSPEKFVEMMELLLRKLDESMVYQRELDRKLTLLLARESPVTSLLRSSTAEAVVAVLNQNRKSVDSTTTTTNNNDFQCVSSSNRKNVVITTNNNYNNLPGTAITTSINEKMTNCHKSVLPRLPLCRMRDFENLERQLINPLLFQEMVNNLTKTDGNTVKDVVCNVLKRLFTAPLALCINWTGKLGKKSFRDTIVCSVVTTTCARIPVSAMATPREIESMIKLAFRMNHSREQLRLRRARIGMPLNREPKGK